MHEGPALRPRLRCSRNALMSFARSCSGDFMKCATNTRQQITYDFFVASDIPRSSSSSSIRSRILPIVVLPLRHRVARRTIFETARPAHRSRPRAPARLVQLLYTREDTDYPRERTATPVRPDPSDLAQLHSRL